MMKTTPRCQECNYMSLIGRAEHNGNNRGLKGPRANCYCTHPKATDRCPRTTGFIDCTPPGENVPKIKTAPRWCPRRQEE